MNMNDYINESELLINGVCGFYNLSKGAYHYHRQIEIVYVEKGMVTINTGIKSLTLTKNQFAILKPYELHNFDGKRNKCVCPILPDIYSNKLAYSAMESCVIQDSNLDALNLFKMYPEFNRLSPESRLMYFNNIYLYLKNKFFSPADTGPRLKDQILEYVHNNFHKPISLESIAAACGTNHTYVSGIINKHTHMNFNNYINRLRLAKFIDSFDPAADKIIEAASRTGFESTRTFYRAFQNEYGMTPSAYFALMNTEIK